MDVRAEVREHRLLKEITTAVADCGVRLTLRFDEIRDDMGFYVARDRAEIATLRKEMVGLYRRLQDVEHRLFESGPRSPEAA